MNSNKHITRDELRTSLNLVIIAITFGMTFFTVVNGATLTGFIKSLGAGDFIFGVIMAMPVIGGILQVFASYFLEYTGKRKAIFLFFGFIHRLLWIPVALVPLIIPAENRTVAIWIVTILITISSAANSITGVAFFSWMGALVPADIKGRFFSRRTMISTISSLLTGLVVGKFLGSNPGLHTFAIVFVIIAFLGAADILCFIWIKDPPMNPPKEKQPFLRLITEPLGNKNYMKFILFVSVWNFGVNFSGPFFNVYMIEHLKMSYFFMAIFAQIAGNVSTIIFIRSWGKLADLFGNKPVLALCCSGIVILPLIWCFATPTNYWPVLILNFIAGILWPGYEMTAINLSIWLAPEKNRSVYLANYTLVTSLVGIALAYVCGGAFMQFMRPLLASMQIPFIMGQYFNGFHALFILCSVIRLAALIFLLPRVKEENSQTANNVINHILRAVKPNSKAI